MHLVIQRSARLLQSRDASVLAVPEELLQPHRLQLLLRHAGSVLGIPLLQGTRAFRARQAGRQAHVWLARAGTQELHSSSAAQCAAPLPPCCHTITQLACTRG